MVWGLLGPVRQGEVVAGAPLVRTIRLLEEVPGVTVQARLPPGSSGTSNLAVHVADAGRVRGAAGVDNAGSEATGEIRGHVAVSLGNPSGAGDRVDLQVVTSGAGMQRGAWCTNGPRGSERLALAGVGGDDEICSGRNSALGLRGTTHSVALGLRIPGVRAAVGIADGAERVDWHVQGSWRRMEDEAVGLVVPREVTALSVGAEAMGRRGAARIGGSLTVTWGRLAILEAVERALDAAGPRTAGTFWKGQGEAVVELPVGRGGLAQVRLAVRRRAGICTPQSGFRQEARGRAGAGTGEFSGDHGVSLQVEAGGTGLDGDALASVCGRSGSTGGERASRRRRS